MNDPSLTGSELLAWNDATAKIWFSLATAQPDLLQVPCDIYRSQTVSKLLQHIVAAELRYAERLTDSPVTDYADLPCTTADELASTHARAMAILNVLLADPTFDWTQEIEFNTLTAGRCRARRKVVFQHALLHSIRHYAQLATIARQHGFAPGPMDYLLMTAPSVPHATV